MNLIKSHVMVSIAIFFLFLVSMTFKLLTLQSNKKTLNLMSLFFMYDGMYRRHIHVPVKCG